MSEAPNPFLPATVETVVERLQRSLDRWRAVHAEAETHAAAEHQRRKDRHPTEGAAGE